MQVTRTPLLLGHRGARLYAPENTFAAFDLALAHGCDGFEFDVRLTADARAVICHDARLAGAVVGESTCARLQELAGKRVNPQSVASLGALPMLEQVLARYGSLAVLDIELKVENLETLLLAALRRNPPRRDYWVSSFLPQALLRMHQLDPGIPLGFICDRPRQLMLWRELPAQALFLHSRLATSTVVEELHRAGKQVLVWTVNYARRMRALAAMGVDGILSDDTELLVRTMGQKQS